MKNMTRRADMSRRVIPAREALRIGFRNHLRASLIGNLTRRADMSRRVIPAREALRIGFRNDLRAELIDNFGVGKTIVPDLAQVELAHTQNILS